MASPPAGPWKVCCAQRELNRLRELGDRAVVLAIRQQFLAALKFIYQRLATDPLDWGDPTYRLHHLDLVL